MAKTNKPPFCLVGRVSNNPGVPPDQRRVRYSTVRHTGDDGGMASAIAEAERLAIENPGVEFIALAVIARKKKPKNANGLPKPD